MPSTQCTRSVCAALMNMRLRLEDARGDHRLEDVQLELAAFGGHRHRQVAADHAEADHVDDFRESPGSPCPA